MSRKRPPVHDYICRRCWCACDRHPLRHIAGGSSEFVACQAPEPVLRSTYERGLASDIAAVRAALTRPRYKSGPAADEGL